MQKIARFIVHKRWPIIIVFVLFLAYCVYGVTRITVESSLTAYLPPDTDTKKALDIMEKEFITYGSSEILVEGVTFEAADDLAAQIRAVDGVKSLPFEDTDVYYKDSIARFRITFSGVTSDESTIRAYRTVTEILKDYRTLTASSPVNNYLRVLARSMTVVIALAAVVILLVLLFTSKSFAEVAVFPIVFIVAALMNMGTNYWLGTISFVSNTVCIILQLALAIDYAIILCHRFTEEKEKTTDAREAMVQALAKAIPEIAGSCLTTVAGLLALTFMQLRLGADLGFVLAKSIVCSILTVFLLMPGIMLFFSKGMDKTRHRSFVPKIRFWGKGMLKARYVLPVLFLAFAVTCAVLSRNVRYAYSTNNIDTSRPTEAQQAMRQIEQTFGYENTLVILVPSGDLAKERQVLELVAAKPEINSALGLAGIEVTDGLYMSDAVNYQQIAALGLDEDLAKSAFLWHARLQGKWLVNENNVASYRVPLWTMATFAADMVESGAVTLPPESQAQFATLKGLLDEARGQLCGENYSRLVFNIDGSVESPETFALLDALGVEVKAIYPDAVFAGEAMTARDLDSSFASDNILITLLTIAFIFVILAFTFRSWGIPIVLVAVIQGAIFINFAFPVFMGTNLFFFVYLIGSAIQMGATIDYAIVLTNRFLELRKTSDKRESVIGALSGALPTLITSGLIMTVAALLIGFIVPDPLISSMGFTLGRGTIISILSVMCILPELLYLFDKPLSKSYFSFGKKSKQKKRIEHETESAEDSDACKGMETSQQSNPIARHYDLLVENGNDPVCDGEELAAYMNRWDGEWFIDALRLRADTSVLEIGCGTGRLAVRVAPLCGRYVGIDIAPKTVRKAADHLRRYEHAEVLCGDFLSYPFAERFDTVYASLTFMHIRNKKKAVKKAAAVLQDNGRFVLSLDKNRQKYIDTGYSKIRVYPDKLPKIRKLLRKAGLRIETVHETEAAYILVAEK